MRRQDAMSSTVRLGESELDGHPASAMRMAQVLTALFEDPVEPVTVGRFALLEQLGAGAMGEVYAAYDSDLDRKVAIKLVRGEMGAGKHANDRLFREAQILARLSHPNVVQVYEAGYSTGRVFIAMEYIRGTTLTEWLQRRTEMPVGSRQRAVIQKFLAAGRGLQAAHRLDLAHRDFKPDNVLVSDDGRLRLVDFGLAHMIATTDGSESDHEGPTTGSVADIALDDTAICAEAPARTPARTPDGSVRTRPKAAISLTSTGTIMGTPRFMAPEQMRGQLADARSDQFSFCVALFHALYGEYPFAGASMVELLDAIERGAIDVPRSREVPSVIRKALLRGLSSDPAQRFQEIGELLAVLDTWLHRRRRTGVVLMVAIALAVAAHGWTRGAEVEAGSVCDGGRSILARVWNDERRSELQQIFNDIGGSYAREAGTRVIRGLDRYRSEWLAMHREACLVHRQGHQSDALFDARMVCLERSRTAMDSALLVLAESDADSVLKSVDVVHKLPRIQGCADVESLTAAVAPPDDPATRRAVEDLYTRLDRVDALTHAGRLEEAEKRAASLVADAEAQSYQPILAAALLSEGRARMTRTSRAPALAPLEKARRHGFRAGAFEIGLEALARHLYVAGVTLGDPDGLLAVGTLAEDQSVKDWGHTFAYALLLNNIGTLHLLRRDHEQAREYFELAIAAKAGTHFEDDLELLSLHMNLAQILPHEQGRAELERIVEIREQTLGPNHPSSLEAREMWVTFVANPVDGAALLRPACERQRQHHPDGRPFQALCDLRLAILLADAGQRQAAAEALVGHHAIIADGRDVTPWLAHGYARFHANDHQAALIALRRAIDTVAKGSFPQLWGDEIRASAQLAIGAIQRSSGQREMAQETLQQAVDGFTGLVGERDIPHLQRMLAWARFELAQTLWDAGSGMARTRHRLRACGLVADVGTWYQRAGSGYAWREPDMAIWRRRCANSLRSEHFFEKSRSGIRDL